jgi:1-deoxyxylulose-5-phosphate synthase
MTNHLKTQDGTPISRLCFGAMQFGGKADQPTSEAMYDACRAAGINFFDTAHAYTDGVSETWLGRFAGPERDRVYIASKANFGRGAGKKNLVASLEESRRRLNSDFIDLYYIHRWDPVAPLDESFETLAGFVEMGLIGAIGVSNFAAWQVMKAQWAADKFGVKIAMLQPMYNLVKRQAEVELLPMCVDQNIAAVPYSPLGGGLLSGKYAAGGEGRLTTDKMYAARYAPDWMHKAAAELAALASDHGVDAATLAVSWVAKNKAVTAPIISARSVEQLQPSLKAMDCPMDDELYARISALSPAPPPATDRLEEAG